MNPTIKKKTQLNKTCILLNSLQRDNVTFSLALLTLLWSITNLLASALITPASIHAAVAIAAILS